MFAKHCKTKRKISLSSAKKRNYESDIKDDTNPNKTANDKYLLQL